MEKPRTKAEKLAAMLAENYKPETIRDAYGELHRFLPKVEPTKAKKAQWAREAKASKKTIEELDLDNKQSLINLLFQVQGGHVSCRRASTEIQNRLAKEEPTEELIQRLESALGEMRSEKPKKSYDGAFDICSPQKGRGKNWQIVLHHSAFPDCPHKTLEGPSLNELLLAAIHLVCWKRL